MNQLRSASLAILLTAVGASASAGVITTTFATNNSFAGNMFDLQVGSSSLLLTGIDVHLSNAGSAGNLVSLYTRLGSYVGFESNAAGWTLRDSVSVTSAGSGNATFVNLSDFILDATDLHGVYVTLSSHAPNSANMLYTNGSNSYANADLSLTLGIGKGSPNFTGGTFSPRTWNGSIYYDLATSNVPEPGSLALISLALLAGLGVSQRARRQRAA
jgi:hypothetical protein